MIELSLPQGSPEWHAHRLTARNASEAPAMMGESKYDTREELLKQKFTGIAKEVDARTQTRFNEGHEKEALARPIVEDEILLGEPLYPMVCVSDDYYLSASFDGVTIDGKILFEHKTWNKELAQDIRDNNIGPHYYWQLEQQLLVSGAEKVIFVTSDGTSDNMEWMEYRPVAGRADRLIAGWQQFDWDLAVYQLPEVKEKPKAVAIEAFPALLVQVEGRVLSENLTAFKAHAANFLSNINTDLKTDQDFSDAEKTVKFLKDGEDRLKLVKTQILAQTQDIETLFITIDRIAEDMATKRKELDKLVKSEKEARKAAIVNFAKVQIAEHIHALNAELGGNYIAQVDPSIFITAMHGLKSLTSMNEKVGAAVRNARYDADQQFNAIAVNVLAMGDDKTLVPDFATTCKKSPEDFAAMLSVRRQQRADAEAARLEAERAKIRAEEQAKAEAAAKAKAAQEMEAERAKIRLEEQAKAEAKAESEKAITQEVQAKAQEPANDPQPVSREILQAAVIEHQDDIAKFMAGRDFKDAPRIRGILVEYEKFKAGLQVRKAA